MVLKLYGNTLSPCTARVRIVLHEKQVPFEFVDVDLLRGAHKDPAFMEHQPFGEVPYIVDVDGFELYESRAIMRYIATKYADQGTKLIPTDARGLAKLDQAVMAELSHFNPYLAGIVLEAIIKPGLLGTPKDEAKIEVLNSDFQNKLDAFDAILAKQKYLAGDELTVSDFAPVPHGWLVTHGVKFDYFNSPSRPNLARWWKDITSRPSWLAVKGGIESMT